MLENLIDKNRYISNTNLLYKNAKIALLDKNVIKKGDEIIIYEIDSLKKHGNKIKILKINKLPFKIKTRKKLVMEKFQQQKKLLEISHNEH